MARKVSAVRSRPKLHIKEGDTVFVRAGADRETRLTPEEVDRFDARQQKTEANKRPGRRAKVLKVLPDKRRVVVEGVNMLVRHARPKGRSTRTQQLQAVTSDSGVASFEVRNVKSGTHSLEVVDVEYLEHPFDREYGVLTSSIHVK